MRNLRPNRARHNAFFAMTAGFSIIELLITMAIIMVVSASVVVGMNTVKMINMRQAANDYANLLQNARIQAVKDDKYYSVVANTGPPVKAFVDLNSNGTYDTGEPIVVLSSDAVMRTYSDNPPNLGNLESQALTSSSDPSLNTANSPTFGPRGLPCKPVTSGGYTTCPTFSSSTVTGTSYITFFQAATGGGWEAVVANPAGRIRVFYYSPSSGTWSPAQ